MSSLYNLLAQIGSFLQDGIQYFYKKNHTNEKMYCKFFKIMHRFCFNHCFKGLFSTLNLLPSNFQPRV